MVQKRKAASEARRQVKRVQKDASSECSELQSNVYPSDIESLSSYCLSDDDGQQQETPITPFSPASSRYPSDRKTHLCPFDGCGKAFNRPARLTEHLRSHNNERIFHCSHDGCDKTFLRASHLNHHVKSAHTTIRDYICDREGCGKTFVTGSRLRRHLAAHDGRDKFRCTEYPPCNETFRKHSTLQRHVMMSHLNQKPFPCPHTDPTTGKKCIQAFDTAGHLRAHEARIHGGARFTCTECQDQALEDTGVGNPEGVTTRREATFATYALLQAHMRSIHPPTCPDCRMICSSSRELRRHLEIAHGNVSLEERKIHPCDYPGCGRSFTKKGNLNVHIRTVHDGEKRFICGETDLSTSKKIQGWNGEDACGKRYGSKLALEEHVRTAHLGFKNAKAEKRERLGIEPKLSKKEQTQAGPSHLAMLTGEGYVEESGRHILCLIEQCDHRFHRDYDLWVHMSGKHGLEENDIQLLFMQRTMQGGSQRFSLDVLGGQGGFGQPGAFMGNLDDSNMQAGYGDAQPTVEGFNDASLTEFVGDNGADMAMIDPVLTYTMEQ
ncbi:hypothetical protein AJ80_04173 [Polytolypa hystricis UAMH7299]|uniref:C2H2-type domain-containing protein n=1 Tax=Polytolypa hystricis (strain UAMH7299) TaxID=1447883 RepID=A0A2B7YE95_POLH7|nr:hypothetical protein AJ80_04173 [Polytolypa hystricis UAMH7299]